MSDAEHCHGAPAVKRVRLNYEPMAIDSPAPATTLAATSGSELLDNPAPASNDIEVWIIFGAEPPLHSHVAKAN
jgi:hypothetical protein